MRRLPAVNAPRVPNPRSPTAQCPHVRRLRLQMFCYHVALAVAEHRADTYGEGDDDEPGGIVRLCKLLEPDTPEPSARLLLNWISEETEKRVCPGSGPGLRL